MSRGGRGRGGGGRGGIFAQGSNIMGDFTFEELRKFSTKENALFPDVELPDTAPPSTRELRHHRYSLDYRNRLEQSPYFLPDPREHAGVEHYADRFLGGKGRGKNSSLAKLQDPEEAQRLNKAFFPASVWEPFFERKSVKSKKGDKKRRVDVEGLLAAGGATGDDDNAEEGPQNSEEDQDEDQDEEEEDEEEDGDYDNNYFEDGEDDDDGGGGDDDGGGAVMD